jgi:hypothetical protein
LFGARRADVERFRRYLESLRARRWRAVARRPGSSKPRRSTNNRALRPRPGVPRPTRHRRRLRLPRRRRPVTSRPLGSGGRSRAGTPHGGAWRQQLSEADRHCLESDPKAMASPPQLPLGRQSCAHIHRGLWAEECSSP